MSKDNSDIEVIMKCDLCNYEDFLDNFPEYNSLEGQKVMDEKGLSFIGLANKKGIGPESFSQYVCPNCGCYWMY